MFEKMKQKSFEEGFEQGKRKMECTNFTDSSKITYATCVDYGRASLILEAKDKEIANLKSKISELDGWKAKSNKNAFETEKKLAKCHKELEVFYLKEIGECETVKQVNDVLKQYGKSELYFSWAMKEMADIVRLHLFTGSPRKPEQTSIQQAAATKIKRTNRKNIYKICELLDNEKDNFVYAKVMLSEIKEMTGLEVDGKKILDAKASGLDSMGVFKSILSAYDVKQDDIMAE